MIAPFWQNGLVLWMVPEAWLYQPFHAFEDGYFCPVKFEAL